jgi:hypothetical protein
MVHKLTIILVIASLGIVGSCGSGQLPVAPAGGKVLYRGKSLEFGSVMFQPNAGPPARGIIQPDGTFQLSTYGVNDGAVLGTHRVRVACFESQQANAPARAEAGLGKSLIPSKYANLASSGLHVEVKPDAEPYVFELSD